MAIRGAQSQNEQILAILQSGRSLTPLEALREVGSLRLGARVHNLKALGYDIQTRMVERDGKHFAEYFLPQPKGQLALFDAGSPAMRLTSRAPTGASPPNTARVGAFG